MRECRCRSKLLESSGDFIILAVGCRLLKSDAGTRLDAITRGRKPAPNGPSRSPNILALHFMIGGRRCVCVGGGGVARLEMKISKYVELDECQPEALKSGAEREVGARLCPETRRIRAKPVREEVDRGSRPGRRDRCPATRIRNVPGGSTRAWIRRS
jgi:hypothetical protein